MTSFLELLKKHKGGANTPKHASAPASWPPSSAVLPYRAIKSSAGGSQDIANALRDIHITASGLTHSPAPGFKLRAAPLMKKRS
jgi:hypothetical protein